MKRVFLIGYMGSGKTTIGKKIAEKINMHFIDLDLFIENRYRKNIRQIFEEKGEAVFRKIEAQALKEVAEFEDIVVSTGGGVPCFFNNMALMNTWGTTIYLKVSVEELVKRLNGCKQNRPLIKDKDPDELKIYVSESLKERELFYNQASFVLDTEQLLTETDVDTMVDYLIRYLSKDVNS